MKKQNTTTSKVENNITVVIGGKRTGITTENKRHINRFIKEKKAQGVDYRVLIIDFNNEYKGTKIGFNELKSFKNKTAIIGNSMLTMRERIILTKEVFHHYENGLLLIEGFNKIKLKGNDWLDIIGRCVTNRSKSLDIIMDFGGSVVNVPFKIMENASYIRLHNNLDNINRPKIKKTLQDPELYKLATSIRNTKSGIGNHQFVIINTCRREIFGCSKSEYLRGVINFINDKLKTVKNVDQLHDILSSGIKKFSNLFSDTKHIPISNINREYKR